MRGTNKDRKGPNKPDGRRGSRRLPAVLWCSVSRSNRRGDGRGGLEVPLKRSSNPTEVTPELLRGASKIPRNFLTHTYSAQPQNPSNTHSRLRDPRFFLGMSRRKKQVEHAPFKTAGVFPLKRENCPQWRSIAAWAALVFALKFPGGRGGMSRWRAKKRSFSWLIADQPQTPTSPLCGTVRWASIWGHVLCVGSSRGTCQADDGAPGGFTHCCPRNRYRLLP